MRLLAGCPVTRASPLMRNRNDAKLVSADLVDDAVGEPAQQITPSGASEYRAYLWIGQDRVHAILELREERKSQFETRARRVEGGRVMQFLQCRRNY